MRYKKSDDRVIAKPTIRLSQKEYRISKDGIVQHLHVGEDGTQEWKQTKYQIDERCMLITRTKVRNIMPGDKPIYSLVFNSDDGIPTNANRDIKKYHGWCGTTPDVTIHAYGLRKIIEIVKLRCGDISIKISRDLKPEGKELAISDEWLPVLNSKITNGEFGRPLTSAERKAIRNHGYPCSNGWIVVMYDNSPLRGVCYKEYRHTGDYNNTGIKVEMKKGVTTWKY